MAPPAPSSPPRPGPAAPLTTPLTTLLGIRHPVLLAGMARTSLGPLAAAVSNAGGLGVIGGFMYTPSQLRAIIASLKSHLAHPDLPFGVDLALPQLGGSARKTNHDYTHGKLAELISIVVESGARLFVCAVGVPPAWVVEKLHAHGVLVMNMLGHPKHAVKALDAGVDLLCPQGGEGGGHTGAVASSVLLPAVLDIAATYQPRPKLLGGLPPLVVAAGGVSDGRALAAALVQGAAGVWVGTRFVASVEAGCSEAHKQAVVAADYDATERTLVLSGRPLRMQTNDYIREWHEKKADKIKELTERGVVPIEWDLEEGNEVDPPHLMGQVAGRITEIKPAAEIVSDMVQEAVEALERGNACIGRPGGAAAATGSKL